MEMNNQIQKAGDNSQQIQAGTVIIQQYGITEERVREICVEISKRAIKECTDEATAIANKKIEDFENVLIPKIQQIEGDFKSFSDPGFQVLLKKAQLTAMCSERQDDYKLLSELLVHRIKNKTNIKKKASITRAVEIIDQIDDDALCAMTIFHAINSYIPVTGDINEGLKLLDNLYNKLGVKNLPNDNLWIDNLAILGAVRVMPLFLEEKVEDYVARILEGYVCVGIKKDEPDYFKAKDMLSKVEIDENMLVDNELLEGFVRLLINNKEQISNLQRVEEININGIVKHEKFDIKKEQIECLNNIWNMYSKDITLKNKVKNNLNNKLNSFENIKKAYEWRNSIKDNIILTSVGRVIAHTYAKSIDNTLPNLD